jgi:mannose-1-phosphate guanylyltransferase/mannose-6-phosphate isomerase
MKTMIPVILSGGFGARLWPVSRRAYPKPFMKMADGQTLAEKTLRRALDISGGGDVLTVTGRDHYFITRDEYLRVDAVNADHLHYLLEPAGRNTAPAIAVAACMVQERWGGDAQMLIMPADHVIQDQTAFAVAVKAARQLAGKGHLVTFGIHPTHPETGYGYIRLGDALAKAGYRVDSFVEKPELDLAKEYLESGQYLWNSGMFCFAAARYLKALAKHMPELRQQAEECWQSSDHRATPVELDGATFSCMVDISIDYAVMEKAENAAVVRGDFGWSDVGSWQAMSALADADDAGNKIDGRAVVIDSKNCFIQGEKRLIATVGVENLVIVDTGDAVLIADQDRAQDVKTVVERLHQADDDTATYHQTVYRPWGSFTVLENADDAKVKRLVIKPGQVLSLQLHHRRSEHWTVVSGIAKVRVGEREFELKQNESVFIPMHTLHRLENTTDEDIALIEVQCGDYFGEDDIERLEDVYGRV